MPISHVDWKKAFRLVFSARAEALEYFDKTVRSPSDEYFIPAVVRLFNYDKFPKSRVTYSRQAVLKRDGYTCQYCSKKLTPHTATIDHVLPKFMGGKTIFENTVASCWRCNNKKGPRTPKEANLKLNRMPFKPNRIVENIQLCEPHNEWLDYLPRGILNELQINSRDRREPEG